MKRLFFFLAAGLLFSGTNTFVRVNIAGYLPDDPKTAVYLSREQNPPASFAIHDALTGKAVYESRKITLTGGWGNFTFTARMDFSGFTQRGSWYISAGSFKSDIFRIGEDVYEGLTDVLLTYMRQQQCGYNPFLKDSCHTKDGFRIYHPAGDSQYIDVRGGWHDASDYLRYVTTSATVVYQMLAAYEENPDNFSDLYDASGNPGKNGIADILDQAKWGVDWLMKMNPAPDEYYNQIADDRDHSGFRLPNKDSVRYGKGLERPVYFLTGEVQGVLQYKNRTEGVASTAAKFASAFARASYILADWLPDGGKELFSRAVAAYNFAKKHPGKTQTAPGRAPYFYEEDNWVDDMELAAVEIYTASLKHGVTGYGNYLQDASFYAAQEKVTPWIGSDTARHYQWYPFVNYGHYLLAHEQKENATSPVLKYIIEGIERLVEKGKQNPFRVGVPFIWCSNNLVSAAMTQFAFYRKVTGSNRYAEYETAHRDWLLGCNPWGVSMIIGFPRGGNFPKDPHSSLAHLYGYPLTGGLVDGPVYTTIFNNLKWVTIVHGDEYADAQPGPIVFHDDYGDYSTNEPTHDGTAGLLFYFGEHEREGKNGNETIYKGAVIRSDSTDKSVYLVFTGHEYADGGGVITSALNKYGIKASFFFTGDFYRNESFSPLIKELVLSGHYLGAHSDKHLLYCTWEKRDSLLITRDEFFADVRNNYAEMERFGITKQDAPYYLPPYEWYNDTIAAWTNLAGLQLVNHTPGTGVNQDWTIPLASGGTYYYSSDSLYTKLINYEEKQGLKGHHLLMHIGTDERRTDKFYRRLDALITELKKRGYTFKRF